MGHFAWVTFAEVLRRGGLHDDVVLRQVVLTLGRSRVVHTLLRRAAETKNFTVIVTEGRPDGSGV